MTEAEWFASNDLHALLDQYPEPLSIRKVRLYSAACLRHPDNWPGRPEWLEALECVERYADQRATEDDLLAARSRAQPSLFAGVHSDPWDLLLWGLEHRAWGRPFALGVAGTTAEFWQRHSFPCVLLRDIFGNPFRPVAFDPAWRTDTALALARQAYDSREFSSLPILADALQDAGCDCEDLLNHLRDTSATHARGCWAVDLVLDRT